MIDPLEDADAETLTAALREDFESLSELAELPPAGLVWWRSTIRARAEAARIAERPITLAQTMATACIIALALGMIAAAWRAAPEIVLQHAVALVFAVAFCLLIAPIAVFAALGE